MARLKEHNQILQEKHDNYYKIIDEANSTTTYFGQCSMSSSHSQSAPIWQIRRVTISGTQTTTDWPNGDDSFTYVWTNRASLTYG